MENPLGEGIKQSPDLVLATQFTLQYSTSNKQSLPEHQASQDRYQAQRVALHRRRPTKPVVPGPDRLSSTARSAAPVD